MTLRFGTDGVRGLANDELSPEYVLALGRAAARAFDGVDFVVGRDTRRSGPLIEGALSSGLAAEGADVLSLGVAPTPVVAGWAARSGRARVVVCDSHNPAADKVIKIFAPGGRQHSDI